MHIEHTIGIGVWLLGTSETRVPSRQRDSTLSPTGPCLVFHGYEPHLHPC